MSRETMEKSESRAKSRESEPKTQARRRIRNVRFAANGRPHNAAPPDHLYDSWAVLSATSLCGVLAADRINHFCGGELAIGNQE
jgi:hypothetical protein